MVLFSPYPLAGSQQGWGSGWGADGGVSSPGWEGSLPFCPTGKNWSLGLGTSWRWDQSISRIFVVVVFNYLTFRK